VGRTRASVLVRVLVAALLALLVAPLATASGTEREQLRVRVYVLDFDPLMDTGTALTIDRGWTSPIALDEEYRSDVRIASGGVVDQRIVRTSVVRGYPVKPGGFTFTNAQCPPSPFGCWQTSRGKQLQLGVPAHAAGMSAHDGGGGVQGGTTQPGPPVVEQSSFIR